LVACASAAFAKIWVWWPAQGGIEAGIRGLSLSAAGDFLAGVAAVPAFAWIVVAYFAQRSELNCTVTELSAQSDALRQQLAQMKKEHNRAYDPSFELQFEKTDERSTVSGGTSYSHAVTVKMSGHDVESVQIYSEGLTDSIAHPRPYEQLDGFRVGQMRRLFFHSSTSTIMGIRIIVEYVRKNDTYGQQRFLLTPNGQFAKISRVDFADRETHDG
jgi:hypothetical protein